SAEQASVAPDERLLSYLWKKKAIHAGRRRAHGIRRSRAQDFIPGGPPHPAGACTDCGIPEQRRVNRWPLLREFARRHSAQNESSPIQFSFPLLIPSGGQVFSTRPPANSDFQAIR